MGKIIDGKKISGEIKDELKDKVDKLGYGILYIKLLYILSSSI